LQQKDYSIAANESLLAELANILLFSATLLGPFLYCFSHQHHLSFKTGNSFYPFIYFSHLPGQTIKNLRNFAVPSQRVIGMDEFKCGPCEKTFSTKESYEQHNAAKHKGNQSSSSVKKQFKLKKRYVALAITMVIIALFANWTYSTATSPGKYDEFAKCLNLEDAKFYGAFWCPSCANQKAMFGKSAKYLDYVECSTPDRSRQTQVCVDAGIESYPTWEFADSSRIVGVAPLQQLADKTGCTLAEG
jgi:uncharacterized C2H2 Zn-finger protein